MVLASSARVADPLRTAIHGDLVAPGDPGYDAARAVHSASFDRHPAAVVRAADPADVIQSVTFAREHGLPIAVRSGGHSMAGHGTADGALVVDLGAMKDLSIDARRGVARAAAGLTAGEYTAAAHAHGLATPFGDTTSVGLGGLTLGGGIGFLVRRHGLTIDSLLSVEMVTADGRLVTASEDDNPDLFWALRGGGGNFGIVTSFEYRLHPVSTVFGGALVQPATPNVLRSLVPLAASAPDGLTTISHLMAAPPAPFIPADRVGQPVVATLAVHAGAIAEGERAVAPLRAVARPVADTLGPIPYPAIYQYTSEGNVAGRREIVRSMFVDVLDDSMVDALLDFMPRASSPAAMVQIRVLGGAMARVAADATAFAHRNRPVMLAIITPFVGPASDEEHVAWTEGLYAALRPHATGVYSNFLGDEGDDRVREAYPTPTLARLAAVKRTWDPENAFRLNQNIRPA